MEETCGALRAITAGFVLVLLAHTPYLSLRNRKLNGLPTGSKP